MKMWPLGQSITLSVIDPDIGDEHEFGLVDAEGGEDNHMFTLVGNELRSNATYDHEANSSYSVLISATDITGLRWPKHLPLPLMMTAPRILIMMD